MMPSLSARRAWIEMLVLVFTNFSRQSLSARRAWIEMSGCWLPDHSWWVALRKESVDRNIMYLLTASGFFSRSPQGERG